tara:strand:- start:1068 stop:1484 length:417 start_codon:yes stop_codon:yes gene_type:complete
MSLSYYRLKSNKFDDLNIFICELDKEYKENILQESINYLQNYIVKRQYAEQFTAVYVSFIKHNTKTTKPMFTANNEEKFNKFYKLLSSYGNSIIKQALQETKETEIFFQNLEKKGSIMVAKKIEDNSDLDNLKKYYFN